MRVLGKTALVLGLAGAMALGSMTASDARGRGAAVAAGAAGFAVGAAIGSAAAANNGYYGGAGYDAYGYDPGYVAAEPAYVSPSYPAYVSPSYYGPVGGGATYDSHYSRYNHGYDTNYIGPWRERKLEGLE